MRILVSLALLCTLAACSTTAQQTATPPVDIYANAMANMHANMHYTPTGDADADFVMGMIPHHQGAVDMAEILVKNGKDKELRRLGKDIIAAQKKEIAFMEAWLKKHNAEKAAKTK